MNSRTVLLTLASAFALLVVSCGGSTPERSATTRPPTEPPVIETVAPTEETATEDASPEIVSVRIGVNANSFLPLVATDGGKYRGFEIDVATEVVSRLYGNDAQIEWVPITSPERFSSLEEGRIDMLVRSLTHTTSREEVALFSDAYLLSGPSFMVFREDGYASVADLDGQNISVVAYYEQTLSDYANALGFTFNPVVSENLDEAQGQFGFARAEALFDDFVVLAGIWDKDLHAVLVEASQLTPIGIGFPLGAEDLRDQVNESLSGMIADGTWQTIFDKWFGVAVPWNLDEMMTHPASQD